MSGLIGALLNGAQSLNTQSEGLQLAGKNLANTNTPGYARQRLVIGSLGSIQTAIGSQSMGTQAIGIQQIRDLYLDAQMNKEISQTNLLQAMDSYLQKAQADLGEQVNASVNSASIGDPLQSGSGISSALSDFFNAASALSANPTDSVAKEMLIQKADLLASKINLTDSRLAALQSDVDVQNAGDLKTVNSLLTDIASLNDQIQQVEIGGLDTAPDLRDQREAKLEELAKYMDFTTQEIPNGHGQIQVLAKDSTGANVLLVDKAVVNGQVSYDSATKTFLGGNPATTLGLTGGSLQGNILARDGAIQDLRDNLSTVAQQLTASINAAYNPGGTGNNFFTAAPTSGLIQLDPTLQISTLKTSSDGSAGGNDLVLAVAGVANQAHSITGGDLINGTISGFYSASATGFGQTMTGIESKLADQQTVQSLISAQRDAVSGVSQDEEMTKLIQYQRGFQASARVINVIDTMLDTVVNGLIR